MQRRAPWWFIIVVVGFFSQISDFYFLFCPLFCPYFICFLESLSEGVKLLKGEYVLAAIRKFKMDKCLIFCRTKIDCDNLEEYMLRNGEREFSCVCLHSDKRPDERNRNLQIFKDGKVKFIICTDVAARGIDIRGLPFVINVTLPDLANNYIHRIGR